MLAPGRRCDRVDARSLIQGAAEYRADEAVRSIVRGQDGLWKRKRHEAEGIWWDAQRRPQSPIGKGSSQDMFMRVVWRGRKDGVERRGGVGPR